MAEIYPGSNTFIETARDKLITELTALLSSMATGYSPTFSYLYEKHNTAKLQLNAVSVDLEGATMDFDGYSPNNSVATWYLTFSIRVHTDYAGEGANMDSQANSRLLNSIINKLRANLDLGSGYRVHTISNVNPREIFEDSDTVGGSVDVLIVVPITHTQE